MSRFTKKISSQELAEDCTLLSETVLVDGQEMIYDGAEDHTFAVAYEDGE